MKRLLAACLLALCLPQIASAAEIIHRYDVTADITTDRMVTIEEKIEYDFGQAEKHGIMRDIPTIYSRNGGKYNYRYEMIDVLRDGKSEPYEKSNTSKSLHLKIGDADITITGKHTYTIRYRTDRAINDFPEQSELYWNVIGPEWTIPIEQSTFKVTLPKDVGITNVSSTCFTGVLGSQERSCQAQETGSGATYSTTRVLSAYEGFTAVLGFPVGTVTPLTTTDKIGNTLKDNAVLFFPLIAFILMFFRWSRHGRDPKLGAIIPEYEAPAGYAPATLASAATEGSVPDRAITATIIDLASRGYLKINFGEEKGLIFGATPTYTFIKTNKDPNELKDFERDLYDGIFKDGDTQEFKDLKKEGRGFYQNVQSFKKHVQAAVDGNKLFAANPLSTRAIYILLAFGVGFGLAFFSNGPLHTAAAVATGIIIAAFGWIMPKRNQLGTELLQKAKGFEWFMSVTEKDRLDFHNAPERTPQQFMAVLPFAIAFGLEKKWAQQFASLNIPPPTWAEGAILANFSATSFASNLNTLNTTTSSTISSAGGGGSGFSGGGSGGGGGGGGGGSW